MPDHDQQQNPADAERYTASTITDPALDRLYAELDDLRRRLALSVAEE